MSEKNAAFHRLAEKRVENIADAIRVFSNLANPNYEWTPAEVLNYLGRIEEAKNTALARFRESKMWTDDVPASPPPPPAEEPEEPEAPQPETKFDRRRREIQDILDQPGADLAEMIVFQKEVIASLQQTIDELRGKR